MSAAEAARIFSLPDVVTITITQRTEAGSAAEVRATSSAGRTATLSRTQTIRNAFGLKSAHITSVVGH